MPSTRYKKPLRAWYRLRDQGDGITRMRVWSRNDPPVDAILDTADVEHISAHRWRLKRYGEDDFGVTALIDGRSVGLAGFILGNSTSGPAIVYRNGNKFDFRRSNITLAIRNEFSDSTDTIGATRLDVIYANGDRVSALIDSKDRDRVEQHGRWKLSTSGFLTTDKGLLLSHFIFGEVPRGCRVKYRNGNKLDYRRENLTRGNEFIVDADGLTKMITKHQKFGEFKTIIDPSDVLSVSEHIWTVSVRDLKKYGRVYFHAHIRQPDGSLKTVELHRFIMGDPDGMMVDHREPEETLNNRRSNLRVATHKENTRNSRKQAPAFSGYKGVSIERKSNCLVVTIRTDEGRKRERGFPVTPEGEIAAARRYDELALQYHGEFARTNFPRSDYAQAIAA